MDAARKLNNKLNSFLILKGGRGSGHWGHRGVKGQRGGSAKGTLSAPDRYNWKDQLHKSPKDVLKEIERDSKAYGRKIRTYKRRGLDAYSAIERHVDVFNQEVEKVNKKIDTIWADTSISKQERRGQIERVKSDFDRYEEKHSVKTEKLKAEISRIDGIIKETETEKTNIGLKALNFSDGSQEPYSVIVDHFSDTDLDKRYHRVLEVTEKFNNLYFKQFLNPNLIKEMAKNAHPTRIEVNPLLSRSQFAPLMVEGKRNPEVDIGVNSPLAPTGNSAVHEITHAIEHSLPDVNEASKKFWYMRTRGDNFSNLFGGDISEFDRWAELTKVDDFSHKYMGKVYPIGGWSKDLRTKFTNPDTNPQKDIFPNIITTEVLSQGMELLVFNPIKFFEEDPEHAEYCVSFLQGKHEQFINEMAERRGFNFD